MALRRSIRPDTASPFRIPLGPALLYLDDILDVHNDLTAFSQQWFADNREQPQGPGESPESLQNTVELRAQNAIADSVEDLKDATRQELNHVSLVCKSPKIRIDFLLHGAEVIAESDSPDVRSFAESLREFVQIRRSWLVVPMAIEKRELLWPSLGLAYLLIAAFLPASYPLKMYFDTWSYVIFGVLSVWLGFVYYRQYRNAVRITPEWRRERRGISSRVRRDLAVALVSAVVVGVLGLWAGLLVHDEGSQPVKARSVVQSKSCALTVAADGTVRPITCPDGSPNSEAERYYRTLHLKVLSLGLNAGASEVAAAICQDFAAGHTTKSIETSASELASIEQHWNVDPPSPTDIPGILTHCRKSAVRRSS